MATPQQWKVLHGLMLDALKAVDNPLLALVAADKLDRGEYRVNFNFDVDDDGQPDALSCCAQVDINFGGDVWLPLLIAHWQRLELTLDDVFEGLAAVLAQQDMIAAIGAGAPDTAEEI